MRERLPLRIVCLTSLTGVSKTEIYIDDPQIYGAEAQDVGFGEEIIMVS